jgi:hypothetical protein
VCVCVCVCGAGDEPRFSCMLGKALFHRAVSPAVAPFYPETSRKGEKRPVWLVLAWALGRACRHFHPDFLANLKSVYHQILI